MVTESERLAAPAPAEALLEALDARPALARLLPDRDSGQSTGDLPGMVEFIELGGEFDEVFGKFYSAARDWDGKDPVRDMAAPSTPVIGRAFAEVKVRG